MGFWIMVALFVIGAILVCLNFITSFSHFIKKLLLVLGIILIIVAIFVATPFGASFIMQII